MNKFLILVSTGLILFSCNQKNESKSNLTASNTRTELQNFQWLIGKWKRINEEKGQETFENWIKVNDSEYDGIGFTIQNKDTIKQERIKIINEKGIWNLVVKVPDDKESIKFKMSEIKNDRFVCVNDSLDFPKRIEYWKNGEKINATVSGDSLKIAFEFEKNK